MVNWRVGEVHEVLCRVIDTAKEREYTAMYEKHVGFKAQIDAAMQIEPAAMKWAAMYALEFK